MKKESIISKNLCHNGRIYSTKLFTKSMTNVSKKTREDGKLRELVRVFPSHYQG